MLNLSSNFFTGVDYLFSSDDMSNLDLSFNSQFGMHKDHLICIMHTHIYTHIYFTSPYKYKIFNSGKTGKRSSFLHLVGTLLQMVMIFCATVIIVFKAWDFEVQRDACTIIMFILVLFVFFSPLPWLDLKVSNKYRLTLS